MPILFKIGLSILFISLLSACIIQDGAPGLYLGQKDSCGFAVSQFTGDGVRWQKSEFPIPFHIHESVPPEAQKNFISAAEHWNIAWEEFLLDQGLETFPLFSIVDRSNQYSGSPKNDSYNMLFFVTNSFSKYHEPQIQAITAMISSRQGEIKDTDIIVNNENFRYFYDESYNQDILLSKNEVTAKRRLASSRSAGFWFRFQQRILEWFHFILKPFKKKKALRQIAREISTVPRDQVDFASLMVHELGHVPGLAHFDRLDREQHLSRLASRKGGRSAIEKVSSVMEPKLPSGRSRRKIEEYDLNNLFCGYFDYN